ncbi:MAG: alpha-L-glutamate ligase-like protein, partial [Desulfobacterota bacterium]|nr:alpha-L-glutamate ligase-like protein [Thermodesulfobacteriota bacterium]
MWFRQLSRLGILGINQRNADYTLRVNLRKFYLLVDDKLLTKHLAIESGIKVPQLYHIIKYHHEIPNILNVADKYEKFVVKPAKGCAGEGILVIVGRRGENFEKADGQLIPCGDLLHYISGILSGLYSLGGQDDHALVEYKVENLPMFEQIAFQGVPDIRVIVY